MNRLLSEEIKDHMRSKISTTKNILKANDVLSKATTSINFYKHKNKKDIMEKITNILNDKQHKENFDTCYLIGNPNDNAKSPNFKFNSKTNSNNNKDDLLKPGNPNGNRFFKPKQDLVNNYNINNASEKKNDFEEKFNTKREIRKHSNEEGIKAFSPKVNNKFSLNFFDNLNKYRDTNLNKVNMPYATTYFVDKNENKIFTEKVKNEINGNDNVKYGVKNNFKLFYEQLNNSKSKQNKNSMLRESAENKPEKLEPYRDQFKKEEQDKSPKYIKCRDPESTNLFLTKFNLKNKHKDNLDTKNTLINKNFSNSNSLNFNKNPESPNENNIQEKAQKLFKTGNFNTKEVLLGSRKKEIEQNLSKSIDIGKDADSSYQSLKKEFSFLFEKKGESEVFNLRDIINDVKTVQNKLSSECDDIQNLLKYANDTKTKLQMHKTENRFYNVKGKLDCNNNKQFNHQAYTNNINNMVIKQTNAYLKNTSAANKRTLNSNKKDKPNERELNEERKNNLNSQEPHNQEEKINDKQINNNKEIKIPNQNSLSADECLLSSENPKIGKEEQTRVKEPNKKTDKKINLSEANYDAFLPNIADNIGETNTLLQAKNLTSKNQKGKQFICLSNEEGKATNNYYMIKSQALNKKNENEDLIFDPADIEIYNRQMKQGNRNQPNDILKYESDFKSSNKNFNSINNEDLYHDINNKNIFDREIKTIFTSDSKRKYFVADKINVQKLSKNFALRSKLNPGANKQYSNNDFKISKEEENKAESNYIFNNFTGTNANFLRKDSKRNMKNFNEIEKQESKRNFVFDCLEDEKLNSHENIDLNDVYKSNPGSIGIKKKFSGSLNNFHKNKIFNLDSLYQGKKDPHPININKNKSSNPQQLFFKDLSANPHLQLNKNFVDKRNFLEIIKKNSDASNKKNANKFSFEKKNISKTNYNFAEFIKSNGSIDKRTSSDFYKKKNLTNQEKLVISAETNFISNNILNDGSKSKNNKNKFY